ncbi:head maturation protease, ClpP-related [Pseudacidovorax sp. RU35E]|uniref:head maturation protease, ClpP-related n=1 Tax=Pseudacidovorax sp. RU35E TaxID=1907403 RepID=UPI000957251D|nr:head maturation protease, ClpP-related [Pseudacidovorax sp. RU35E]SIR00077.1 ATP-dependent protease ClpP, protease subunit [Pseudacidovorax sp. RU35E]
MSLKTLPGAPQGRPSAGVRSEILPRALDRWQPGIRAAADGAGEDRTISIYDVIGYDYWTGDGVTAKRIAGALRNLGKGPVTVNLNSPGGDMFEGLAIYNLLREHEGEVTVKVLGLAASAGSIIAMAGDNVQVARAGFFMVHNSWVMAAGNRLDLREIADWLEPFDAAMADIYTARTGLKTDAVAKLMDAESWIGGSAAVDQGFADSLLPSDQVGKGDTKASASAVRRLEAALRAGGMPKSEAMRLISEFKSSPGDPAGSGEGDPTGRVQGDPGADVLAALQGFSLSH